MRTPRPGRLTVALAVASLAVTGACNSDADAPTSESTAPTTPHGTDAATTNQTRGGPPRLEGAITLFDVPTDIVCGSDPATVTVRYETAETMLVSFIVDDAQAPGAAPLAGSFDLQVPCDGAAHTIVLVALDAEGGQALDSRVVVPQPGP